MSVLRDITIIMAIFLIIIVIPLCFGVFIWQLLNPQTFWERLITLVFVLIISTIIGIFNTYIVAGLLE